MTRAILLGTILGFVAGLVPGAYSGLVVATALRSGFRSSLRIATVPVIAEPLVLAVTALFLSQLPRQALRWMGLAGGGLIFYLAYRTWRQAGRVAEDDEAEGGEEEGGEAEGDGTGKDDATSAGSRRLAAAVLLSVLSPTPWVFWLLVGAPIFLNLRSASWAYGLAFAGTFALTMGLVRASLAALAAFGGRGLGGTWQARLMRGTAVVLVAAGAALAWQSWTGNFQRMVTGSLDLTRKVEERLDEAS